MHCLWLRPSLKIRFKCRITWLLPSSFLGSPKMTTFRASPLLSIRSAPPSHQVGLKSTSRSEPWPGPAQLALQQCPDEVCWVGQGNMPSKSGLPLSSASFKLWPQARSRPSFTLERDSAELWYGSHGPRVKKCLFPGLTPGGYLTSDGTLSCRLHGDCFYIPGSAHHPQCILIFSRQIHSKVLEGRSRGLVHPSGLLPTGAQWERLNKTC